MFKKLFISLVLLFVGSASFAGPQEEVLAFFNRYVTDANGYSDNLSYYYDPHARIIRVVIKKDGTKESVVLDKATYITQLKLSSKLAKVRNYKNFYTNRKVTKIGSNYKISCMRQPSLSNYKLPAYFVIGKDAKGSYKIKEESMHTYQTLILTKAKEARK